MQLRWKMEVRKWELFVVKPNYESHLQNIEYKN